MTNLQNRIAAEKAITKAIAKACFTFDNSEGTKIYVNYGNFSESICCDNPTQVVKAAFEVDECWLIVKNIHTGKHLATFFMVYGNDGFDCWVDMSVTEFSTKVDKAIEPLINKWEEKLC